MPMLKAPRQVSRRQELRQDVMTTGFTRVVHLYEKYRNFLIGGAIGVLVLIFVGIGYGFYSQTQSRKASEMLGAVVRVYEQGQFRQALDGDGTRPGLREIADRYGRSPDGNLARFYAADALYRLGDADEALTFFRRYKKGEDYIGASAYAGEAAILEDRGEVARAGALYERAASSFKNALTSPEYLLGAARSYEAAGTYDKARSAYERIREEYGETPAAQTVEVLIARLETLGR